MNNYFGTLIGENRVDCWCSGDLSNGVQPLSREVSTRMAGLTQADNYSELPYRGQGVLSNGLTTARLKQAGTTDVVNDLLIMAVINGTRSGLNHMTIWANL